MTGLQLFPSSALRNATASLQSLVTGEIVQDHILSLMLSLPQHGVTIPFPSMSDMTPSFGSMSSASTLVSLASLAGTSLSNPSLFNHYGPLFQQRMAHHMSKSQVPNNLWERSSSLSSMSDDPCCHPCFHGDSLTLRCRRMPTVSNGPEEGCFPSNLLLAAYLTERGNVRPFIL